MGGLHSTQKSEPVATQSNVTTSGEDPLQQLGKAASVAELVSELSSKKWTTGNAIKLAQKYLPKILGGNQQNAFGRRRRRRRSKRSRVSKEKSKPKRRRSRRSRRSKKANKSSKEASKNRPKRKGRRSKRM